MFHRWFIGVRQPSTSVALEIVSMHVGCLKSVGCLVSAAMMHRYAVLSQSRHRWASKRTLDCACRAQQLD
eukprot:8703818-Alexandrium_andersonii.AAC.1